MPISLTASANFAGTIAFDKYRSLVGLLEHLRTVYLAKRNVMHGLYEPHNEAGRWYDGGPSDMVVASSLMIKQLQMMKSMQIQHKNYLNHYF